MAFPVYIPLSYTSRYELLGAMAHEAAAAFAEAGCAVNPAGDPEQTVRAAGGRALVLFFNHCAFSDTWTELMRAGSSRGVHLAVVQMFVDHPLALDASYMDTWANVPGFRTLLPCPDGLHWLAMRWPWIRHAPCAHAVPQSALAPAESLDDAALAAREFDVVVTGSIHTQPQVDALAAGLPPAVRAGCDEMIDLLSRTPWMSFETALDLALGQRGLVTGRFAPVQRVWAYVTAAVNRARRLSMVRELEGRRVVVFGPDSWSEVTGGTIVHGGHVAYAQLPAALRRGRVCLAWGPTQFVHGWSERLLLGLAAGCACVCDDRMLVRRDFSAVTSRFDAAQLGACAAAVDALLADPTRAAEIARAGHAAVQERHLWRHRLQNIVAAAQDTVAAAA